MIVGEEALRALPERFLHALTEAGFVRTGAAELTAADASLTFVNANITPFKSRLLAGERLGATCQLQPCVRSHGEAPFLFYFGMLGTMTDAAFFDVVCDEVPSALLTAMPWTTPQDFTVAVDPRDADLIEGTRGFVEEGAAVFLVAQGEIETRWSYGSGDDLTGRGLTIMYTGTEVCGPDCRPRCECGRWQEIGNIIVVQSPETTYVETGFGLESMQATAVGGQLYRLPWISELVRRAERLGLSLGQARDVANLSRVLESLSAAGARPGGRGAGHVMRRFIVRLIELAEQLDGGDSDGPGCLHDLAARLSALSISSPLQRLILEEDARRERNHRARLAAAQAYLRRITPDDSTARELRSTYGLTSVEVAGLLVTEQPMSTDGTAVPASVSNP